jgi:hypothetical protein
VQNGTAHAASAASRSQCRVQLEERDTRPATTRENLCGSHNRVFFLVIVVVIALLCFTRAFWRRLFFEVFLSRRDEILFAASITEDLRIFDGVVEAGCRPSTRRNRNVVFFCCQLENGR